MSDPAFLASPSLLRGPAKAFRTSVPSRRRRRNGKVLWSCRSQGAVSSRLDFAQSRQSRALAGGSWFKMICGASSQDLPRIRNLSMLYAALGVDCVDAAADPAVVRAVRDGFSAARALPDALTSCVTSPWLMVSVNADEDPHFRKAQFDPAGCPPLCPRPCEAVCPADAIDASGVITDVCYGCGRCIPVCPPGIVSAVSYVHTPSSVKQLVASVDALEIHTELRHGERFGALWDDIGSTVCDSLRLLAISFPDPGSEEDLDRFLNSTWQQLASMPPHIELVWQTDGRPMSGDIGKGTARASVKLGIKVKEALNHLRIPGHVQLAGGTNDATVPLLEKAGMFQSQGGVAGIAIGGHARKIVGKTLDVLQSRGRFRLEDDAELLADALAAARPLVEGVKRKTALPDGHV